MATLNHLTEAVPTLAGRLIQASAHQLRHRPDASAIVGLILSVGSGMQCLPLDPATARRLAAHLSDCAGIADRHNSTMQDPPADAPRDFVDTVTRPELEAGISDMVGLRP